MIERMQVVDFQRHERLRVSFDSGVTTIVGPSDAGKSAVLRALRWALTNRPGGDGFVRAGGDAADVRVWVDGHKIRRHRGKENLYEIDGETLKSFGVGVPEPVERAANVGDVNFQGQIDPPFWFTLTPGELAKQINAIVDLGAIDDALADVASRHRRAKAAAAICEERIVEATAEAVELSWVPQADAALAEAEAADAEHARTSAEAASLASLLDKLTDATRRRDEALDAVSGAATAWADVDAAVLAWESAMDDAAVLTDALDDLDAAKDRLTSARAKLEQAEASLAECGDVVCPECGQPVEVDQCRTPSPA